MKQGLGPFPSPAAWKQMVANNQSPFMATISGEITTTARGLVLGAADVAGKITNVWLSILGCGRDDSNDLYLEADVKIDGTSCVTTKPRVPGNSGEASEQKTTKVTGDTGVVQCVIDTSNNAVNEGSVITYDLEVTRTATPTTEMHEAALVIELEPQK